MSNIKKIFCLMILFSNQVFSMESLNRDFSNKNFSKRFWKRIFKKSNIKYEIKVDLQDIEEAQKVLNYLLSLDEENKKYYYNRLFKALPKEYENDFKHSEASGSKYDIILFLVEKGIISMKGVRGALKFINIFNNPENNVNYKSPENIDYKNSNLARYFVHNQEVMMENFVEHLFS